MIATAQLTSRQQRVYDAIITHVQTERRMPSVRELGTRLGISSPNGVSCHLRALAKKGIIEREFHKARSIRLVEQGGVCPCCGK